MASDDQLVIRTAVAGDSKRLAELHYLSHTTSFADFAEEAWVLSRDFADYLKLWRKYLADQAASERTWLAESAGTVVGTVTIMALANSSPIFRPKSSHIPDSATACLRLMYVHPDWLRQGIGQRLVAGTEGFIRNQDYQAVSLITHAANQKARAFYQEMGWSLDEVFNSQVEEFFEEPAAMRQRARYVRYFDK